MIYNFIIYEHHTITSDYNFDSSNDFVNYKNTNNNSDTFSNLVVECVN